MLAKWVGMRTVNFELQAKEVENDHFGRIWGFHKNDFIKPSSSDPNAPNSN